MRVKVLSNINSGQYNKGDIVDFPDNEVEQLIEAGAVEKFADEQANDPQLQQPQAPAAPEVPASQPPAPEQQPVQPPQPEQPVAPAMPQAPQYGQGDYPAAPSPEQQIANDPQLQ